jgi:predicted RNase H-related nuclease YkuK (DUF458 family)
LEIQLLYQPFNFMLKGKSIVRRRIMEEINLRIESAEKQYDALMERLNDEYDEARRSLESKLEADKEQALTDVVSSITGKLV